MRKLRMFEHVSLDGVIQAPGSRNEDGDYPYGGWTVPFRSSSSAKAVVEAHAAPFDVLLGRRTYDIWSGHWPKAGSSPLADGFNAATKYVVTHRPETLEWGSVQGLGPDIVADVQRTKASNGPDLILWGSSTLSSPLLEHGVVDELILLVHPVLLGVGKRLFAEGAAPCALALAGSQAIDSGVVIHTYTVAGPLMERLPG